MMGAGRRLEEGVVAAEAPSLQMAEGEDAVERRRRVEMAGGVGGPFCSPGQGEARPVVEAEG